MDRLKTTLLTAFVIAILLLTPAASAQPVAANITVVSGNGQMICPSCGFGHTVAPFYPMVVKVTDASGKPIANTNVNWQTISSNGTLLQFDTLTATDGNGLSESRLYAGAAQVGSVLTPFLQNVISATVDSGVSVNFTETVGLTASGIQLVNTRLDAPIGTPLTGPAGTTGTSPIQVHIDAFGLAVPNVSVRLQSPEITTASGQVVLDPNAPSASCAPFGTPSGKPVAVPGMFHTIQCA